MANGFAIFVVQRRPNLVRSKMQKIIEKKNYLAAETNNLCSVNLQGKVNVLKCE